MAMMPTRALKSYLQREVHCAQKSYHPHLIGDHDKSTRKRISLISFLARGLFYSTTSGSPSARAPFERSFVPAKKNAFVVAGIIP